MAPSEPHRRSVSTRVVWKPVKIESAPQGTRGAPPKASARLSLGSRDLREPLTLTVAFRGGAAGWWDVQARGQRLWVPSHQWFAEVLFDLYQGSRSRG